MATGYNRLAVRYRATIHVTAINQQLRHECEGGHTPALTHLQRRVPYVEYCLACDLAGE